MLLLLGRRDRADDERREVCTFFGIEYDEVAAKAEQLVAEMEKGDAAAEADCGMDGQGEDE